MIQKRITKQAKHSIIPIIILMIIFWLLQFSEAIAAPSTQEGQDVAIITEPANNAALQGVVPIIGTATHPTFAFYVVEFSPEAANQWQFIGDGQTQVTNGQLATWDTTTVPDGIYTIRLRVVRIDANYSEAFSQQVVVSNTQPIPTETPEVTPTAAPSIPTITPTPLPPTPTIIVDQPIVDTPTPRPIETSAPLQDPDESSSFIPTVSGFSLSPLRDACLYGGGLMLSIFLLFGFLAALRMFVQGFIDRIRHRGR